MPRTRCEHCGTAFVSPRGARFCSRRCKDRAWRQARAAERAAAGPRLPPQPTAVGRATRAELERLGAVDSMLGQQVLMVAARMGDGVPGSALRELSREHSRLMDLIETKAEAPDRLGTRR